MDETTIIIILGVLLLLGYILYTRSRPAPPGTYDDEDVRSSGSIGGRQKAYDDKDVRSSGSIGDGDEGAKAYDDPEHRSGGSFGGD